jgi:branched-subunit amino acid ABC-type transport system permease component
MDSILAQRAFYLLIIFSLLVPAAVYRNLWRRRAISRPTVLAFGVLLILLAGIDVYLLRLVSALSKLSPSTWDDVIFNSELTVALYLLPTLFAGTGLNIISHLLIRHLTQAERRFARMQGPPAPAAE